jgi:hypothetical protein
MRSNRSERSGLREAVSMTRGDYGGTVSNSEADGNKNKIFEKNRSGKMLEILVKKQRNPAKKGHHVSQASA